LNRRGSQGEYVLGKVLVFEYTVSFHWRVDGLEILDVAEIAEHQFGLVEDDVVGPYISMPYVQAVEIVKSAR